MLLAEVPADGARQQVGFCRRFLGDVAETTPAVRVCRARLGRRRRRGSSSAHPAGRGRDCADGHRRAFPAATYRYYLVVRVAGPRRMAMNRTVAVPRSAVTATRTWFLAVGGQPERTLLLGTILLALSVSAATGFGLAQYYSVDVLSSLYQAPEDCWLDWATRIGRHCFSDYPMSVYMGMRPDPWGPIPMFLPVQPNPSLGVSDGPPVEGILGVKASSVKFQ
jgi:hypothetical protein